MRKPTFRAAVVEPILVCCINGISINDLEHEIQKITPLSHNNLKKYLLYLIDYHVISYNGQRQVFTLGHEGYDLMDMITKQKRMMKTNKGEIIITLE